MWPRSGRTVAAPRLEREARQHSRQALLRRALALQQLRARRRELGATPTLQLYQRGAKLALVVAQQPPRGAIGQLPLRDGRRERSGRRDRFEQRHQPRVEHCAGRTVHRPRQRGDQTHYVYWCIF